MASSTLIIDYLGQGTHAARPATPGPIPTGGTAIYVETDTLNTFIWLSGAWVQLNGGAVNLTGPITSVGAATSIASQTGTGTKFVVDASPTLTGVPAAPTAAPGTNTTQIATTAFVAAASGGGSGVAAIPQGRLTLSSGLPVMLNDVTAATTIYYDSFLGNLYPNWNGSTMANITITTDEISCGLDAGVPHIASGKVYDIYGTSGAAIGVNGAAWLNPFQAVTGATNATPIVITANSHGLSNGDIVFISGVQGNTAANGRWVVASSAANTFALTGSVGNGTYTASTGSLASRGDSAELQFKNGVLTNKNSITHLWGGASGTTDLGAISANQGTYLGSLYATANGQTAMVFQPAAAAGGNNNFLALYNAYNRVPYVAMSRDSTSSWTYTSATWRAANAAGTGSGLLNRVTWLDGLGQSVAQGRYNVLADNSAANTTKNGCDFDSTSATPGGIIGATNTNALNNINQIIAEDSLVAFGLHFAQAVESVSGSTATYLGSTQTMGLRLAVMQ